MFQGFDGVFTQGIRKTDAHQKYFDIGSVIDVQQQYPVDVIADGEIGLHFHPEW